ncbi:hypothetical protein ACFLU5_06660 [Bacteroidota bacterium]
MRLSKLARELSKTPSELIEFYEKRGIKQYTGANSKINDEHVKLTYKKFRPELLEVKSKEKNAENSDLNPEENGNIVESVEDGISPEEGIEIDRDVEIQEGGQEEETEESSGEGEHIEVIRAPKIKLEGVKVVGKIDLPETGKSIKNEENINTKIAKKVLFSPKTDKSKSEIRSGKGISDKKHQMPHKEYNQRGSQLSYEEKLQRDKEKLKRAREKKQKSRKEKKKQHYLENVKPKIHTTSRKKSKKGNDKESKILKEKPVYSNPIRKFIAWLNCEYDQYE